MPVELTPFFFKYTAYKLTFQGIHATLDINVLMAHVFRGQKHVLSQLSAGTELIRLLCAVSYICGRFYFCLHKVE